MIALNVELKTNNGSERQTGDATLNAKMKRNGGSECQTRKGW